MSPVTLSWAEVILCLSSSMLAGSGGSFTYYMGTGPMSRAAISTENCLHLIHARSIPLIDSHWNKHVLSSSIRYKILIGFYSFSENLRLFQQELPILLASKMMSNVFWHPVYILLIGLADSVFTNGPGDLGSTTGRVIPKTPKMVLNICLLNTQHYKACIKGKVEQSKETSSAFLYTSL